MKPHQNQLNLPPSLLPKVAQESELRNFVSQSQELTEKQADLLSKELFHLALESSKISSKEVGLILSVGAPLVSKWRSQECREAPSHGQMLRLPHRFQVALRKLENERLGLRRHALKQIADATGDLLVLEMRA